MLVILDMRLDPRVGSNPCDPPDGDFGTAYYRWKRVYGGLGVAELRRLKLIEEENRKLKQPVADLGLDKHILQDVL